LQRTAIAKAGAPGARVRGWASRQIHSSGKPREMAFTGFVTGE
jgi:hypothetical protein